MWEDEIEDGGRRKVILLVAVIVAAVLAVGGWYWWSLRHAAAAPETAAPPTSQTIPSNEPQIAHPLAGSNDGAALPALNDSDQVVHDSLVGVLGKDPVEQFLAPQNIVRHVVVTVDNLSQHKVAVDLRPIKPTAGQTIVTTSGDSMSIGERNFARYTPLTRVVQATDVKALVVVYKHLYPLFQQAYEDLGYPGKYFNDRLVQTIDNLLLAPEVAAPIPVVQPKVFYQYADADLEARSAGQKLLIRMGPSNARIIKDKLRQFRAEIINNK
jgi:Protein of unknown function (DUF3014)